VDRNRLIVSVIGGLVGVVWILQGLGVIQGRSFMVGEPFWVLAGVAMIGAMVVYYLWPRLRRR
jgi:hypothetical protein